MKTRRVNVEQLQGTVLDWAVAVALGWRLIKVPADCDGSNKGEVLAPVEIKENEWCFPPKGKIALTFFLDKWSTDWSQGGPLIQRFCVDIRPVLGGKVESQCMNRIGNPTVLGSTVLESACRAIVAAQIGTFVEIPEELL